MKQLAIVALILSISMATIGCHQHRNEGPAERAGRHIDDAADDTRDAARDVKEDIKKAGRDIKRDIDRNY